LTISAEAIEVTDSNAAIESAAQLIQNRALFITLLPLSLFEVRG
jgi:hypothetical protein